MKTLPLKILIFGVAISAGQNVTVLTSDGNGADAFVRQGEAERNFGRDTNLFLKGANNTTTRKVYLRFDLSAVDEVITDASLSLTVGVNNSGGENPVNGQTFNVDLYGLTDESLDDWVEGDGGSDNLPENEITYANAPANVSPSNNFSEDAVFLGTLTVPGTLPGETLSFRSPELLEFLKSDTNGLVSILMRRQLGGSNNLAFRSKEAASGGAELNLVLGVAPPLEITEMTYDAGEDRVTLSWRDTGAGSYAVVFSADLMDWSGELASGITAAQDENPADSETLTVTFDLSALEEGKRRFFRVTEGGE